jgi:hypothetical protein
VRKNGIAADDLLKKYDSGWDMFNWGPGRVAGRAMQAYTNYGDIIGESMMRFLADRFMEETSGDPLKIRRGYSLKATSGWGEPNVYHIGHAALVSMVDEKYRTMLENMSLALKEYDTSDNPQNLLGQAYYLMHLTGLMDFSIVDREPLREVAISNIPTQPLRLNQSLQLMAA